MRNEARELSYLINHSPPQVGPIFCGLVNFSETKNVHINDWAEIDL